MADRQGISNRETATEEAREREEFPPQNTDAQEETSQGGDEPLREPVGEDRQTSIKSGSRSTAQKESESRYVDRPQPSSGKVPGAFGKEGND